MNFDTISKRKIISIVFSRHLFPQETIFTVNLDEPDELKKKEVMMMNDGGGDDSHHIHIHIYMDEDWDDDNDDIKGMSNCADNGDERVKE